MELVADAAFRAVGQHRGALVAQRVRMLDPAEFSPGGMEFPGHAEKVQPKVPAVGGRHRVVVVPPAAGRQAFEFEVAEMFQDFRVADRHVAAVVEHRHVGIEFPRRGGGADVIILQHLAGEGDPVRLLLRIEPGFQHPFHAVIAAALPLVDDVEKNAVRIREQFDRLFDQAAQIVEVRRVETELDETAGERFGPLPLVRILVPFRVQLRNPVVESGGHIDRHLDVDLLRRIHLLAQQVELQMRMHRPDFGRMVTPAVMTGGKAGDRIDVRFLQPLLPLFAVEFLSDAGDIRRSVKVKMNLTESQVMHTTSLVDLFYRSKSLDCHDEFRERPDFELKLFLARLSEPVTGERAVAAGPSRGFEIRIVIAEHPALFGRHIVLPHQSEQCVRLRLEREIRVASDDVGETSADAEAVQNPPARIGRFV